MSCRNVDNKRLLKILLINNLQILDWMTKEHPSKAESFTSSLKMGSQSKHNDPQLQMFIVNTKFDNLRDIMLSKAGAKQIPQCREQGQK